MSKISNDIKSSTSKAWGYVPEPVRGVFYILGAAGIVYAAYKVYKKITTKDPIAESKEELQTLKERGISPTLTDVQVKALVGRILSSASGQNFGGTNESAIYSAFSSLKNDADFNKLIIAFGEQRKSFSFAVTDLFGWISHELSDDEILVLNRSLTAKGINYKF